MGRGVVRLAADCFAEITAGLVVFATGEVGQSEFDPVIGGVRAMADRLSPGAQGVIEAILAAIEGRRD